MKKIILIISLELFLPFLLIVIPTFFIRSRIGTSMIENDHQSPLVKDKPIGFTFTSTYSNLNQISLDFKNPNLNNNSLITVDINSPNEERSVVFYGSNIGDPSTIPLKFSPFHDPVNTLYQVKITTENTDHSSLYLLTNKSSTPTFRSYYQQTDIFKNFKFNIYYQYNQLLKRQLSHNIIYLVINLCLAIYLYKKW